MTRPDDRLQTRVVPAFLRNKVFWISAAATLALILLGIIAFSLAHPPTELATVDDCIDRMLAYSIETGRYNPATWDSDITRAVCADYLLEDPEGFQDTFGGES